MHIKITVYFLLIICLGKTVSSQPIVNYRNVAEELCNEKDAWLISVNEAKNGLWHRSDYYKQTNILKKDGYYKDSANTIKHGQFTNFYPNNNLESTVYYQDNLKEGVYLSFYSNGMMQDSLNFKHDIPLGVCNGWYPNGAIRIDMQMDSTGTGKGVAIGLFENGNISFKGLFNEGLRKAGNWFYYYDNGTKASVIQYPLTETVPIGKPSLKFDSFENIYYDSTVKYFNALCYNKDGIQQDSCNLINKKPEYKDGLNGWRSYLEKKTYDITSAVKGNSGIYFIRYDVFFLIDSNGATSNVMLDNAIDESIDYKVGKVFRDSKLWTPAKHNNRNISYTYTQSLTLLLPNN